MKCKPEVLKVTVGIFRSQSYLYIKFAPKPDLTIHYSYFLSVFYRAFSWAFNYFPDIWFCFDTKIIHLCQMYQILQKGLESLLISMLLLEDFSFHE